MMLMMPVRFDFQQGTWFNKEVITAAVNSTDTELELNFHQTIYVDSSALGLLLVLRDHLKKKNMTIRLFNCNPLVKNTFMISAFYKLFDIK